jgi:cytochrome c biogenesis factor
LALLSLIFEICLKKITGVWLAHFGFILSIINILIFHMFKIEYHINLLPLEKIKLEGIEIIFRGYELIKKQIYTSNYGNFIFKWNDST